MKKSTKIEEWYHEYKIKRRTILIVSLVVLIIFYAFKNMSTWTRVLSFISFLVVFYLVDRIYYIKFRFHHYIFIIIIGIASFLLSPLYFVYPNYDKIQHLIQPAMFCSIIFHLVNKLNLRLRWKLFFTFFIMAGLLGMFEVGEYCLDYFFDLKLQGVFLRSVQGLEKYNILVDEIDDTMIDLSLGIIGSLAYVLSRIPSLRTYKR